MAGANTALCLLSGRWWTQVLLSVVEGGTTPLALTLGVVCDPFHHLQTQSTSLSSAGEMPHGRPERTPVIAAGRDRWQVPCGVTGPGLEAEAMPLPR